MPAMPSIPESAMTRSLIPNYYCLCTTFSPMLSKDQCQHKTNNSVIILAINNCHSYPNLGRVGLVIELTTWPIRLFLNLYTICYRRWR